MPESATVMVLARGLTARVMRQAKNSPVYVGASTSGELIGQMGHVTSVLNPRGTVYVAGEQWTAESDNGQPIQNGKNVLVTAMEGLVLKVFQADEDI